MRVTLAHDYLTQRGGAERVALRFAQSFSSAPMLTSVYQPHLTYPRFQELDIHTSFLQHFRVFREDPRRALPLLSLAWDRMMAPECDVVLASSTGWAHGVRRPGGVPLVVYCHNPARWLYQTEEYERSAVRRRVLEPTLQRLRRWDQRAAERVSVYLANSTVVASRIRQVYGREASVVHPPVMIDTDAPRTAVSGVEPGFWLTIARGRGYKNVEAVIEGIGRVRGERLVVVGAPRPEGRPQQPHVTWLGIVTDAELRWLYSQARALLSVSREDFGLTPIEANAFGTPVAVLRAGGFLDTTVEGVSGLFIESEAVEDIEAAVEAFPAFDVMKVRANADRFSVPAFASRIQEVLRAATGLEVPRPAPTLESVSTGPTPVVGESGTAGS